MKFDKYFYYENAVQDPQKDTEWFAAAYREIFKKDAHDLREDFCGTFMLSCEWIKRDPRNTVVGLDLDPEPLNYGKKHHLTKLTIDQKKRLKLEQKNVISVTPSKRDLIIACNFSFFVFKDRPTLLKYLKACYRSLKKEGMLVLEMVGGPGFIQRGREQRTLPLGKKKKFVYYWDQRRFNPVNNEGFYAIHFDLPGGKQARDVFTYDWRIWTIREVREAMIEAGFNETYCYWETGRQGAATGDYTRSEKGANDWSWTGYVGGVKR